jgi:hypothetical protein
MAVFFDVDDRSATFLRRGVNRTCNTTQRGHFTVQRSSFTVQRFL